MLNDLRRPEMPEIVWPTKQTEERLNHWNRDLGLAFWVVRLTREMQFYQSGRNCSRKMALILSHICMVTFTKLMDDTRLGSSLEPLFISWKTLLITDVFTVVSNACTQKLLVPCIPFSVHLTSIFNVLKIGYNLIASLCPYRSSVVTLYSQPVAKRAQKRNLEFSSGIWG